MGEKMNVLSLFDGISGCQQSLKELDIKVDRYFASEIDKHAISITQYHFPNTIQLGDVCKIKGKDLPGIDFMSWGSPCQDLSIGKKNREGLKGSRSGLFWEAVRILNEVKPKYFLMENVASMPDKDRDIISKELGVYPIMIDSALVTAQGRERYYWTNIEGEEFGLFNQKEIPQPKDRKIYIKDILVDGVTYKTKSSTITTNLSKASIQPYHFFEYGIPELIFYRVTGKKEEEVTLTKHENYLQWNTKHNNHSSQTNRAYFINKKMSSVTALLTGNIITNETESDPDIFARIKQIGYNIRMLYPVECERLQSFPDDYTSKGNYNGKVKDISPRQRYKVLGNSFTVEVIKHILKYADFEKRKEGVA